MGLGKKKKKKPFVTDHNMYITARMKNPIVPIPANIHTAIWVNIFHRPLV